MNVSQQILSFSQQMDTNKTQKVKSNQGFEGLKGIIQLTLNTKL